jgi:hypothetical protein
MSELPKPITIEIPGIVLLAIDQLQGELDEARAINEQNGRLWAQDIRADRERLQAIVEDAFGLHVLDQGDWFSVLERNLFEQRQKHSKALAERDAYREQCEDLATQLERALSAYSTAAAEADRAGAAELTAAQVAENRPPGSWRAVQVYSSLDTLTLGPAFTTVRACRHCGALITGGPTACVHCVARRAEQKDEPAVLGAKEAASAAAWAARAILAQFPRCTALIDREPDIRCGNPARYRCGSAEFLRCAEHADPRTEDVRSTVPWYAALVEAQNRAEANP